MGQPEGVVVTKKTIIVAGGSTGLGREVTRQLTANDDNVVVLSPEPSELQALNKELGCTTALCDVSDALRVSEVVSRVAHKFGRIDALVNSAAVWAEGRVEDSDPAVIERTFSVNVIGAFLLARAVIPHLRAQGGGRIVNVVSMAARSAKAERAVYCATKAAVASLTDVLALELAADNINVCGVYPGPMRTPFYERQGYTRDMEHGWLDPEKVARTITFILSQPLDVLIANTEIRHLES